MLRKLFLWSLRELERAWNAIRKEKDALGYRLEESQSSSKVQKSIKEQQAKIVDMEEELEAERQARAKAETEIWHG